MASVVMTDVDEDNANKRTKTLASGSWFNVSGEGKVIPIFGQDPKEVAKIYGMFLLHSVKLKTYVDQNNPCRILVCWPLGEVYFKAWYMHEKMESNVEGTVIVIECYFVKKPLHHVPVSQHQTTPSTVTETVPAYMPGETSAKLAVLRVIFKYDNFKGNQEEATDAIHSRHDSLVILPTGAG
ncbi:Hypothetical predicted protein [Paramuricea clavata]|uniref:Uncharacterized protein n=1 Tax=Paramuricea clavata TaxID=317549 RepID=A0A7D9HY14_PARCT|nr:Hypothetical predicted protein [Paramuricea clavata]